MLVIRSARLRRLLPAFAQLILGNKARFGFGDGEANSDKSAAALDRLTFDRKSRRGRIIVYLLDRRRKGIPVKVGPQLEFAGGNAQAITELVNGYLNDRMTQISRSFEHDIKADAVFSRQPDHEMQPQAREAFVIEKLFNQEI